MTVISWDLFFIYLVQLHFQTVAHIHTWLLPSKTTWLLLRTNQMLPPVLLTGAKWFAQVHPCSTAAQYYLFISPIEILPSPAEGFKAATFWSQSLFPTAQLLTYGGCTVWVYLQDVGNTGEYSDKTSREKRKCTQIRHYHNLKSREEKRFKFCETKSRLKHYL